MADTIAGSKSARICLYQRATRSHSHRRSDGDLALRSNSVWQKIGCLLATAGLVGRTRAPPASYAQTDLVLVSPCPRDEADEHWGHTITAKFRHKPLVEVIDTLIACEDHLSEIVSQLL